MKKQCFILLCFPLPIVSATLSDDVSNGLLREQSIQADRSRYEQLEEINSIFQIELMEPQERQNDRYENEEKKEDDFEANETQYEVLIKKIAKEFVRIFIEKKEIQESRQAYKLQSEQKSTLSLFFASCSYRSKNIIKSSISCLKSSFKSCFYRSQECFYMFKVCCCCMYVIRCCTDTSHDCKPFGRCRHYCSCFKD